MRVADRPVAGVVALAGERGDIIPAALSPAATTACCKLEGGLYASNVVLGRLIDVVIPEVDAMVKELVLVAADAATNHTSEWARAAPEQRARHGKAVVGYAPQR